MSDQPTPHRPTRPRLSHLHSEPVPISFASPQQLAQFAAGTASLFPVQMKTPQSAYGPPAVSGGHPKAPTNYQPPPPSEAASGGHPKATTNYQPPAATSSSSREASLVAKPLEPLAALPVDLSTFKGLKFVTLDPFQLETRDIYDTISGTFLWEMCEGQEARCIDFIRTPCQNRRVFLISSGGLGEKIVPQIHELPQLYAVYIYCANVKYHREWAKKYPKVRVVCDNDDLELLPQFAVDVAQANIDWGNALLNAGTTDKAKEKFILARDKLNNHARNYDRAMEKEIQTKLAACN